MSFGEFFFISVNILPHSIDVNDFLIIEKLIQLLIKKELLLIGGFYYNLS